jgi:MutS domain III
VTACAPECSPHVLNNTVLCVSALTDCYEKGLLLHTHMHADMPPQLEFERVQHHMTLDRDAVASLRILPPSRTRTALQKSVLCTIRGSAAALSRSLEATGRYGDSTAACVSDGRRSLQLLQQQQQQGEHCAEADVMHGALRGSSAPGLSQSCNGGSNGGCRASVRAAAAAAAVAAPPAARAASLFGFLNHTATSAGARLLRTNLLQPLTDIPTLELRLDSLQVWSCLFSAQECCMHRMRIGMSLACP